jgi:hypothetical protein
VPDDDNLLTADQAAAMTADAQARTAAANATAAEVAAAAAQRVEAEAQSSESEDARKATLAQTAAEADKAAAAAQAGQLTALIPDLTKVDRGELQVTGDQPLFANAIAYAALEDAAAELVRRVAKEMPTDQAKRVRVLLTSDTSLVSSDATYLQLSKGLEDLNEAAASLLAIVDPAKQDNPPQAQVEAFAPAAAAAAVASAVPAVLSLFSAHRTVTSAAVDPGSLAACASVAGQLRHAHEAWGVSYDAIRLLPAEGPLLHGMETLTAHRENLIAVKLGGQADTAHSTQIDAAVAAIDTFVGAATAVPTGSTSSPLMTAMLREQLHGDDTTGFTHVLVATGNAGAAQGVTQDGVLWGKSKFATVSVVSLTYFLLGVTSPDLLAAGTVVGTATGSGSIGGSLTLKTTVKGPVSQ